MAETLTPHYSWIKPDIGGDASTWGNVLNQTIDAVDSVVWANQQAGLPIGSVSMFAGATAPPNWIICDGSSVAKTGVYAGLFGVIGYTYGGSGANFNLPNLSGTFPRGAGTGNQVGQSAGSYSYTIDVAHLPVHAHPITDVAHSHSAFQNAHNHGITTGNHAHVITTGSHAHTVQQWGTGGGVAVRGDAPSYFQQNTTVATSTVGNLGGNTDTAGNLGGYTDTQQPGVGIDASGTGLSTTQNVGSGAALSIVPKYVALNFIIRFQ